MDSQWVFSDQSAQAAGVPLWRANRLQSQTKTKVWSSSWRINWNMLNTSTVKHSRTTMSSRWNTVSCKTNSWSHLKSTRWLHWSWRTISTICCRASRTCSPPTTTFIWILRKCKLHLILIFNNWCFYFRRETKIEDLDKEDKVALVLVLLK